MSLLCMSYDLLEAAIAAARENALEEAAQVADERAREIEREHPHGMSNHATYDAAVIARDIRALKVRS